MGPKDNNNKPNKNKYVKMTLYGKINNTVFKQDDNSLHSK